MEDIPGRECPRSRLSNFANSGARDATVPRERGMQKVPVIIVFIKRKKHPCSYWIVWFMYSACSLFLLKCSLPDECFLFLALITLLFFFLVFSLFVSLWNRITSKIKKFVKAHTRYSRLKDEVKRQASTFLLFLCSLLHHVVWFIELFTSTFSTWGWIIVRIWLVFKCEGRMTDFRNWEINWVQKLLGLTPTRRIQASTF